MEIKVNIPKNDYVQPTEVRVKVVQDVCNHIIYCMNNCSPKEFYDIRIKDYGWRNATLYISYRDTIHTEVRGLTGTSSPDNDSPEKYVKVRTCEMKAVFKAMQKAGYHIFSSHCITDNVHTYVFTTKPVLDGRMAKKIDFSLFID